jgi:hypothetical protein
MQQQILEYTYENFERDVQILSSTIKGEGFDLIVGVSRGGLWPAVRLSHLSGIPMVALNYSLQDENRNVHFCGLTAAVSDFYSKKILIVEDIADTGNTLQELFMTHLDGKVDAKAAALIFKPRTCKFRPKYLATIDMSDAWIQFPWENK